MGVFNKFKDLVGIEDVEDDEITEEEIKAAQEKLEKKPLPEPRNSFIEKQPQRTDGKAPVVPSRQEVKDRTGAFKLVVIEPSGFDECPKLVDNLRSRKPVIINLEKIESETARRIFDFLSGATYALNGNVQKISNNIFVFAPENVDISANVDYKGLDLGSSKNMWR